MGLGPLQQSAVPFHLFCFCFSCEAHYSVLSKLCLEVVRIQTERKPCLLSADIFKFLYNHRSKSHGN